MEFTSIDRIFTKVSRDLPHMNITESDIIEWTGEALEFINAIRAKEESVAFVKVSNYQCDIPANLHNIIQIAKNTEVVDSVIPNKEDYTTLEETTTDSPNCGVYMDCNGIPWDDTEIAYYRPYYDLKYEYELWGVNPHYARCYVPVRLTNHHFFNTLVCSENGTDCGVTSPNPDVTNNGLYNNYKFEYTIIAGKAIRFNFEKGLVAIAYEKNPTDDQGLPLIPDDISFTTAIVSYITMKYTKREFLAGKQGAQGRMQVAQQDWTWYVKQASTNSLMPKGVDEMENLVAQQRRLIPPTNFYDNYFGNSNNREVKNILNTGRYRNNYGENR